MRFLLLFLCCITCVSATLHKEEIDKLKLSTLYNSLDPTSISQLFAFYELYPQTAHGKAALTKVWDLLYLHKPGKHLAIESLFLPSLDIQAIIALVNKQPYETLEPLSEEQLGVIDHLAAHLHNRSLKGYNVTSAKKILTLDPQDIDLARALLLYQYENSQDALLSIRQYEASLDLMALQILARLPKQATDIEKIDAINYFVFHDMQFRFPPQSLMAKDIDVYTFLPSVLDGRKGVCLGVSILYLSLAQRINLPLEIMTPPGHIYVRYHKEGKIINIETTARGIHIPSENYLGINNYAIEERTIKEVVGMAFFNQASVLSAQKDYQGAIKLYEKAKLFSPDDPHITMFLGLHHILLGQVEQGKQLLKQIAYKPFFGEIYHETMLEDLLTQSISKEALEAIFMRVDDTRESILEKQKALQALYPSHPRFKALILQLAVCWLQLGRHGEALQLLHTHYILDPHDPTILYYMSVLSLQRLDYPKSWEFLSALQKILTSKNHTPQSIKHLEYELRQLYPEMIHKDCILL